jgi:hypothetical protein
MCLTFFAVAGFLSIDCGSDESYYDNITGIWWETDAKYIQTGDNIRVETDVPTQQPALNKGQDGTLRYFNDSRSRDCYVLPVQTNETYLLRPSFFYGNLGNASAPTYLKLYIDNTLMDYVSFFGNVPN